jgi:hydrogenase maturation protease
VSKKIAVLGIGNVLIGDDAFGPYVVGTFEAAYDVHPDIDVLDVGTPGLDLVPHLVGYDTVIIVDTVRSKGEPGDLRFYTKADIIKHAPMPRTNPHDPGLKDTLLMLELLGSGPSEVFLVGVVPSLVKTGTGLSPILQRMVDPAVTAVAETLTKIGYRPIPKSMPGAPDIWWERMATCG